MNGALKNSRQISREKLALLRLSPRSAQSAFRAAVIDIGTNSIKLLVGEVTPAGVEPICEESEQTRLGQGFYQTRILQPESIQRTAGAIKRFWESATSMGAQSVRLIATSAARDAHNAQELLAAIEGAVPGKVEIISGQKEAQWAYAGVTMHKKLPTSTNLVVDVGGGSTELILGHKGEIIFSKSYPLGTVRILEQVELSDPPAKGALRKCRDLVKQIVKKEISPDFAGQVADYCQGTDVKLIGSGGTASILGMITQGLDQFDRQLIEEVELKPRQVSDFMVHLWSLPLVQRKQVRGLPPSRADVILPGLVIYETLLAQLRIQRLGISTRGLRFAVLREAAPHVSARDCQVS